MTRTLVLATITLILLGGDLAAGNVLAEAQIPRCLQCFCDRVSLSASRSFPTKVLPNAVWSCQIATQLTKALSPKVQLR